jgi:hypothetical protein
VDQSDQLAPVWIGWCREISRPPTFNDSAKIPTLIAFAAQARAAGAKDLAINLLWRAAQRCWWSSASDELRASVLAAANRLELPETNPSLIAICGYVEPLRRAHDIRSKLERRSETDNSDPAIARILGATANVIGAFDPGASILAEFSAALGAKGRLAILRVL